MHSPVIGITANLVRDPQGRMRHEVKQSYLDAVTRTGGVPIVLPAIADIHAALLQRCDGIVITGGDDIDVRPFGVALHPEAQVMDPARQAAEFALLRALDAQADMPLLGICLGMQLLLEVSSEFGETPGLGILPGRVDALPELAPMQATLRLPHVGWAALHTLDDPAPALLTGVPPDARFYFVHSYACRPEHPACVSTAGYLGVRFAALLRRDQVLGVQFHPEKSGPSGLRLLRNFLTMS